MNNERLYDVILATHMSEKAYRLGDKHKQFVFKVALDASKLEIKNAVERLFKVQVTDVNVVRTKGKTKHFKQRLGKRSDWKKAYVSLAEGQDINFANVE